MQTGEQLIAATLGRGDQFFRGITKVRGATSTIELAQQLVPGARLCCRGTSGNLRSIRRILYRDAAMIYVIPIIPDQVAIHDHACAQA